MRNYPQELNLDHIYRRIQRNGKYVDVCFTDQTEEEQKAFLDTMSEAGVKRMCIELAITTRALGLALNRAEASLKKHLMQESLSMKDSFSCLFAPKAATTVAKTPENPLPFGYNADGTANEREREVVRFVLRKHHEYYFHPPRKLIDEAHEWAASEGMTLNDEEAEDMARLRIAAYIAVQVNEQFPDVRYRKAKPPTGKYPTGLKYPSRAFNCEEFIDQDLYEQVKAIMSHS